MSGFFLAGARLKNVTIVTIQYKHGRLSTHSHVFINLCLNGSVCLMYWQIWQRPDLKTFPVYFYLIFNNFVRTKYCWTEYLVSSFLFLSILTEMFSHKFYIITHFDVWRAGLVICWDFPFSLLFLFFFGTPATQRKQQHRFGLDHVWLEKKTLTQVKQFANWPSYYKKGK